MTALLAPKVAPRVFLHTVEAQDRYRRLFAGMTPQAVRLHHLTAEYECARDELHRAIRLGHAVDEQRWLEVCDRLSADLDAMDDAA